MIHAVLALLVLLAAIPATAQDAQPLRLRLTLDHRGEIWVGQRVTVTLTVMTPARFVGAIAWPELTASQGRIIVLPEADTLPGTERVGSESYVALTRSYTVFPATPGEVVLNQALVSFGAPEVTERVIEAVQTDGTCWAGVSRWQGHTVMRVSVCSWATTDEDVERSIDAVLRVAARVTGRAG